MNQAEKDLYEFVMERTKVSYRPQMEKILQEMIQKKKQGKLNKFYLLTTIPQAITYLSPESVSEVEQVVMDYYQKNK